MLHVLLVEDNDMIRNMVKEAFEGEVTLIETYNGKEAIVLFEEHDPDVVISDVNIPDGVEWWLYLQAFKRDKRLICISGDPQLQHIALSDAVLKKPFNLTTLLALTLQQD